MIHAKLMNLKIYTDQEDAETIHIVEECVLVQYINIVKEKTIVRLQILVPLKKTLQDSVLTIISARDQGHVA